MKVPKGGGGAMVWPTGHQSIPGSWNPICRTQGALEEGISGGSQDTCKRGWRVHEKRASVG